MLYHPENDPEYKGLTVNNGVGSQPITNPYARPRPRRTRLQPEQYVEGILRGDISLLGQAVTLVESSLPSDRALAQKVIEQCLPHAGHSTRLGITGVPGAGKSTFIEALGMQLVHEGHKLAVLAIDPSSERSKGSILGDKTRMEELSTTPKAFIRPSPSAGSLGGVARKTRESIVLCEAAGFDIVFVETVGVGQSETAVHSMVDFFLLLQLSGTGDELQGIKRGIMEMADGIAINKCDGNNIEKARLARSQFDNALHLFPPSESGWTAHAVCCSAYDKTGINDVWQMVVDYIEFTKKNKYFDFKRNQQAKYWMYESINEQLRANFYQDPQIAQILETYEQQVLNNQLSSFVAAHRLLDTYFKKDTQDQ
ncbi:MAG: methylmalonyl Co-A mutase-associated GTPase MeaB [Paludibacteraceae bacterium]|nr:methylmalonyl Co-A mutase-associated GTPase MeaB [Paludibacteraceae bacterium]